MRDYRSSCIPDLKKCSVLQALMWWQFRQQPVSPTIEAKLNRTPNVYSQQWTLSDTYAFFELCEGRVAFWGKPAKDITTEFCGSEFKFNCTDCGELEQIPHIRLMGSIVTADTLYDSRPLFNHFVKNPSGFWAYLFVEVDFAELRALFPLVVAEAPKIPRPKRGGGPTPTYPEAQNLVRAACERLGYEKLKPMTPAQRRTAVEKRYPAAEDGNRRLPKRTVLDALIKDWLAEAEVRQSAQKK